MPAGYENADGAIAHFAKANTHVVVLQNGPVGTALQSIAVRPVLAHTDPVPVTAPGEVHLPQGGIGRGSGPDIGHRQYLHYSFVLGRLSSGIGDTYPQAGLTLGGNHQRALCPCTGNIRPGRTAINAVLHLGKREHGIDACRQGKFDGNLMPAGNVADNRDCGWLVAGNHQSRNRGTQGWQFGVEGIARAERIVSIAVPTDHWQNDGAAILVFVGRPAGHARRTLWIEAVQSELPGEQTLQRAHRRRWRRCTGKCTDQRDASTIRVKAQHLGTDHAPVHTASTTLVDLPVAVDEEVITDIIEA